MSTMKSAPGLKEEVFLDVEAGRLAGELRIPETAHGIILFAHGSGSSRLSPRNRFVAQALHQAGLGTLLFDLLTPEEEEIDEATAHLRFNVHLLSRRLEAATDWIAQQRPLGQLPMGYFGASTGAAAALIASTRKTDVLAVVSRGGRPDLAGASLAKVTAATLLIVGELDHQVLELNQEALRRMQSCRNKDLEIVPGATHLFEEPGTLEEAARLAADWFEKFLHTQ